MVLSGVIKEQADLLGIWDKARLEAGRFPKDILFRGMSLTPQEDTGQSFWLSDSAQRILITSLAGRETMLSEMIVDGASICHFSWMLCRSDGLYTVKNRRLLWSSWLMASLQSASGSAPLVTPERPC